MLFVPCDTEEPSLRGASRELDEKALGRDFKFFTLSLRIGVRVFVVALGCCINVKEVCAFGQYVKMGAVSSILIAALLLFLQFAVTVAVFEVWASINNAAAIKETLGMPENDSLKNWLTGFMARQRKIRLRLAILWISWLATIAELCTQMVRIDYERDAYYYNTTPAKVFYFTYSLEMVLILIIGTLIIPPDFYGGFYNPAELLSQHQRNRLCEQDCLISVDTDQSSSSYA